MLLVAAGCSNGSSPDTEIVARSESSAIAPAQTDISTTSGEPEDAEAVTATDVVTRSSDAVGDGVRPEGFSTVTARITSVDGDACEVCLWLADDEAERGRGLMGVTDLGRPVGMAFVWDEPIDGRFFMLGTPTPLSIAWFAPGGDHLSETDMEPCLTDDSSTCERYGSGGEYDVAIEMFRGELGAVGIGPGSSVELLDGSESPTCALDT